MGIAPRLMSDFHFRVYRKGDEDKILAAFGRVFANRRTLAEWHAIYTASPDGFQVVLCLDEHEQIVAHYAATLHRAICQGQTTVFAYGRDAFSLPQYRSISHGRRGLFQQTTQALFHALAATEDASLIYGFASPRHFRLGRLTLGYQPFNDTPVYRCRITSGVALEGVVNGGETRTVKQFDASFDRLWESRKKQLQIALVRDARFLSWRFAAGPGKNYHIWTFSRFFSREILGYVVIALKSDAKAYLVDFCLPDELNACRALWEKVSQELAWLGIAQVESWFSDHTPERDKLRMLGFEPTGKLIETPPAFLQLDANLQARDIAGDFYFTMADSDLY